MDQVQLARTPRFLKRIKSNKNLHVCKLLHGRQAGEVKPGHVLSVFVVISFILQVPEGGAAQSVKLQCVLLPIWICNNIDIYRTHHNSLGACSKWLEC